MSSAAFAFVPEGGRGSIKSRLRYCSRWVLFDSATANCVTSGSPSRTTPCARNHALTAAALSSSPVRTVPARSMLGVMDEVLDQGIDGIRTFESGEMGGVRQIGRAHV